MEAVKDFVITPNDTQRLIVLDDGDYVAVHHGHLDRLIGSVMAILDMNGDSVQREAQKSEIKMRIRQWLTDQYDNAGYQDYLDRTRLGQKIAK